MKALPNLVSLVSHVVVRAVFLMCAALGIWAHAEASSNDLKPPSTPIPSTFFGMHIHRAFKSTAWPSVPFGAWRLWDSKSAWVHLQPEKGRFEWQVLDREVELAQQHNVEVLLTLGRSPQWASARPREAGRNPNAPLGGQAEPRDLEDWRGYIHAVAKRYKGRIKAYEIWNEPNLPNFYTGTPEVMVRLAREVYTTIKEADPDAIVVSPSAVGPTGIPWLQEYLEQGGGKYADVIGYHLYVRGQPPEAKLEFASQVKGLMQRYNVADKPLWDTEAGWLQPYHIDREDGPGYMARSYLLNWAAGVSRFYWYAWDNQGAVVRMTEDDESTPTDTARAYAVLQQWLIGARMTSCKEDHGNWVCQLNRDGRDFWIVWNSERNKGFDVPKSWNVDSVRRLSGESSRLQGSKVEIGGTPVLLEKSTR